MIPMEGRIHGVEDILLGFGPKDAGSIPAGSVARNLTTPNVFTDSMKDQILFPFCFMGDTVKKHPLH